MTPVMRAIDRTPLGVSITLHALPWKMRPNTEGGGADQRLLTMSSAATLMTSHNTEGGGADQRLGFSATHSDKGAV
jgi:hypothetical protein